MKEWYQKKWWVRDDSGQKVGMFLAYTTYDTGHDLVNVGFSFCDTRYDKFNKYRIRMSLAVEVCASIGT